jgi:RHS repeat-associated protein
VSDTYTYDAFGVALASAGTTQNVYLYTGEQLDANVGFYYLRARYYAQQQGRFITPDPEVGSIFEPISLHRYLYSHADPVNYRDPSGRAEFSILGLNISISLQGILIAALVNVIGTYVVSLYSTGAPPTVEQLLTAAAFGALGAIFGGAGALVLVAIAALNAFNNLRIIHLARDVKWIDVQDQFIVAVSATLDYGAGVAAAEIATLGAAFALMIGLIFAISFGIGADQAGKLVEAFNPGDLESIFWHKVNKYPQPIKSLLAAL